MRPDVRDGGVAYDDADLLRRARAVQARAYVPYSGFPVGAVVQTEDGHVFDGANVENASYGLSRCAEQSAVQTMASAGVRSPLVTVAVVGPGDEPITPCGACRQILSEFGPDARVVSAGAGGDTSVWRLRDLLPNAFGPARLSRRT